MALTELAKARWQTCFDGISKTLGAKQVEIEAAGHPASGPARTARRSRAPATAQDAPTAGSREAELRLAQPARGIQYLLREPVFDVRRGRRECAWQRIHGT